MNGYRAKQIAVIAAAVGAARLEMRRQRRFDPALFAEVFIREGGVQIPGAPDDTASAANLAQALRAALAQGVASSADPHLRRELDRARREAAWTEASESDSVVGFALSLPPEAVETADGEHLLKHSHGLGPGIFRKHEVVVLPPSCDGASFAPVYAHDLEC